MPKAALIEYLMEFVTVNKQQLFDENIKHRTRHITVALENIFQPHNASAVLRSCDCFGVQDVHIIENSNEYVLNPGVALGASKWLTLHKYTEKENNTLDCIQHLKKQGYKVYATTPHENDCTIDQLPVDNKVALMFGTEKQGLSDLALENADGFVKIPMYGFSESFNISVSAAICLFNVTERLKQTNVSWELTEIEKQEVILNWIRQAVKRVDLLEQEFHKG
jgi:tRNA (guanosine-2'-O-)-methyltransferase